MSHDLGMPGNYEYLSLNKGISIQRQWNKNRLLLLKKINFITKNDIVLDAGCGSGNVVLEFSKLAKRIDGWDINKNSISFLRKKIKENQIRNANTAVRNLLKVKGKPHFSKIILTEVIEHFSHEDYKKMLLNLRYLLLPKGRIFITTPNDKSIWPILEFMLNIFQKNIQRVPTLDDRHLGHFDKKTLETIVEEAGFKIIHSGTMNSFSPFLFFLSEKKRDKISYWESKSIKFGPLLFLIAEKK
ncbi:MAG: class I SAM-dependent methyltransferase [Candidatus Levybacteria bacterium]|nr:class I SAM-dependent methyltransferase [Candidatus Levybacteria bacterium]